MISAWTWLAAQRQRIGTIGIGHTLNYAQIVLFDYLLYPAVIVWLGPLFGGGVMTILSATLCYLLIVLYYRSGRDWLGLEMVRSFRDGPSPVNRLLRWSHAIMKLGQIPALIFLSVRFDPFITVIYLRDGDPWRSGLSRRDWAVFWTSVVISNLYWIGALSFLIEITRWLLQRLI